VQPAANILAIRLGQYHRNVTTAQTDEVTALWQYRNVLQLLLLFVIF